MVEYTVPGGWTMFEDESGEFGITLVANPGPCVCFWRDVRAAAIGGMPGQQESGVGESAKALATH